MIAHGANEPGALLAERLGIVSLGNEGHDLRAKCIECPSSDGFRVHREEGVAQCYACGKKFSRLKLATAMLGNERAAWDLLTELGLEEPRRNGHATGHAVPVDPVEAIARAKRVPLDSFRAFGAKMSGPNCVTLPAYGPDGVQCSTFTLWTAGDEKRLKGKFAPKKPAGLFFLHDEAGAVRLPKPGERWHIVEGPKDAAALHSLGLLACGLNTCAMAAKFARLFAGVDVVLVPDRDAAGIGGAEKTARVLCGVAASVKIAALPSPVADKGGEDVRDVLRREGGREQVLQAIADAQEWAPTTIAPSHDGLPSIESADGRTELANARRFVALHGERIRWIDAWDGWLLWDGRRWAVDDSRSIEAIAKDVFHVVWDQAAELRGDAGAIQFARSTGSARGIGNFVSLARSEPGISIAQEQLDADPWLLNVANGTLDLRTGELRGHDRDDLLTKICPTPYRPDARCPTFEAMLARSMGSDGELVRFVQRAAGYSLSGSTREQVLFFLFGTGGNGKTVLLNAMQETLGPDYCMSAPADLLMAKHGQSHPTELADLFGKRFVSCIEAEDGRRLAEGLVKQLTGSDKIRARRMRENFWQFDPSHKLWLSANHKPVVRGNDPGIWRRIKLIPFTVQIPADEQDKELPEKLRAESPGILAWMVRGCMEWQANGLSEPVQVKQATAEYRNEMDVVGAFIEECCIVGKPVGTKAGVLYAGYRKWAEAAGERLMSQTRFGTAITDRQFEKKSSNGVWYFGIELREGF